MKATNIVDASDQPPVTVVRPIAGLVSLDFRSIWRYRNFLFFLVWRDIKVRYRQTAMGIAWALIKPLGTMLIFSVIMSVFVQMPSDNIAYPVFLYAALLPWNYFSESVIAGTSSLTVNANLITKISFPRLVIPIACLFPPLIDFCLSFIVFLGLMAWFHITPTWAIVTLPLLTVLAMLTAFAVTIWLSSLNVWHRDIGHAVGFFVQLWMFASPIIYPASVVPERYRMLYSLNPMFGVIEGFRWALLGKTRPDLLPVAISALIVLVLLVGGLYYFRRVELIFADVI